MLVSRARSVTLAPGMREPEGSRMRPLRDAVWANTPVAASNRMGRIAMDRLSMETAFDIAGVYHMYSVTTRLDSGWIPAGFRLHDRGFTR